jgi:deazaflavin-dependent oxidoreductase (nitroreductase family)
MQERRTGQRRELETNVSDPIDWNAKIIEEFRANEGRVGGPFEGAPVLLLHTTGAKSGATRVNPMMYLDQNNHRYVFATKSGADTNPDWFYNLRAHPRVTVEVGTEKYHAIAVNVTGEDRDRVYSEQARRYPGFAEYAKNTSRVIPVVELERDGAT